MNHETEGISTLRDHLVAHRNKLVGEVVADDGLRPSLLAVRARALVDAGLPKEALRVLEPAMVSQHGDGELVGACEGDVLWALARARWDLEDFAGVQSLATACLDLHSLEELDSLRNRIVVRAAWLDVNQGLRHSSFLSAVDIIWRQVSERGGPVWLLADVSHLLSYRQSLSNPSDGEARSRARLAATLFSHQGEHVAAGKASLVEAMFLLSVGDLSGAERVCDRALRCGRNAGSPRLVVWALIAGANPRYRRGKWAEAEACLRRARAIAEEFEDSRGVFAARTAALRCLIATRRLERAAEEARVLVGRGGVDAHPMAILSEYRGLLSLAQGNPEDALTHFDECFSRLEAANINSYERPEARLRRAEALIALERYPEAYRECTTGLSELETMHSELEVGHLHRVRALAALPMGRPREAAKDLDAAEEVLRRVGDRFELARTLFDRARLRNADLESRHADAVEALELFRQIGVPHCEKPAEELVLELRRELRAHHSDDGQAALAAARTSKVIARSTQMVDLLRDALAAAGTEAPVLIQGETGTGKEVVARFVHEHSPRRDKAFVSVNCAAVPETLFEREFFGHAKGAFTGAECAGAGLVETAEGGTLFLDEVGEMPLALQPKLLRLLEEGTYRRVGEAKERKSDLRVLAASNRPLFDRAQSQEFRADLYYRLSWFELELLPLRDRPEDLRALAEYFVAREGEKYGREFWLDEKAWEVLIAYQWPGNVRQLQSALSAACLRAKVGGCVRPDDLPSQIRRHREIQHGRHSLNLASALRHRERELILEALRRTGYRRVLAAELLGVARNTLYEKMRKLGIEAQAAD